MKMIPRVIGLLVSMLLAASAFADAPAFYIGGDISALPDLEKHGAIYLDDGKPGDAITIFHNHGCNLFRVRLFVDPIHDLDKAGGATQDLPMVLALSKRIKNCGAKLSLDFHYSDTWADPAKQFKPAEWNTLSFDGLKQKVTDYTITTLQAMQSNGTSPDIVEVGNETTNGMLWPDGKLGGKTAEEKEHQWSNYADLLKAGIAGVRRQLPGAKILIHIDGGGKAGVPTWFFNQLRKYNPDFDIIGLSFYPNWNDSLDGLKKNLAGLATFDKDILIVETAYPYKSSKQTPQTNWPMTPAGQEQFLNDLVATIKTIPNHHGLGFVWWFPEAQALPHHKVWEGGALGWFDHQGTLLPALKSQ
jgi:arabinogalactan endo-1,4-beta-galactosidase